MSSCSSSYEQLSTEATIGKANRAKQSRLQLAEELLVEVDDIEDDSEGEFNAVQDIRRIRVER